MHLTAPLWSPFDAAARVSSRNFHRTSLRSLPCKTEVKDRFFEIELYGAKSTRPQMTDFEKFTFQSLKMLVLGARGWGMSCWKGLSKTQLLQWDRLLDDLQGPFYLKMFDLELYGREFSSIQFDFARAARRLITGPIQKTPRAVWSQILPLYPLGSLILRFDCQKYVHGGKG